jgi:hypothetical protein
VLIGGFILCEERGNRPISASRYHNVIYKFGLKVSNFLLEYWPHMIQRFYSLYSWIKIFLNARCRFKRRNFSSYKLSRNGWNIFSVLHRKILRYVINLSSCISLLLVKYMILLRKYFPWFWFRQEVGRRFEKFFHLINYEKQLRRF